MSFRLHIYYAHLTSVGFGHYAYHMYIYKCGD